MRLATGTESMKSFTRRNETTLTLSLILSLGMPLGACKDQPSATGPSEEPLDYSEWLQENGHALAVPTSPEFTDLQFLKDLIGDRRLVQLGESGHGVSQFNQVKVRLIKFLHEEMGFNVLAFESGIYDCFYGESGRDTLTAVGFMRQSIYPVWWTKEVIPLFEYIKATWETDRPLRLAGFDMQTTTPLTRGTRPTFLGSVVGKVDPEVGHQAAILDAEMLALLSYDRWFDSINVRGESLKQKNQALVDFFEGHEAEFLEAFALDPMPFRVASRIPHANLGAIHRAEHLFAGCDAIYGRDRAMADNLTFLLERAFPQERIITWGHNFHLRHANENSEKWGNCYSMGTTTVQRHREELYTIGLYMYGGAATDNGRAVYNIDPAPEGTLEGFLHQAGSSYFFLDLLGQDPSSAPPWIFERVLARDWGTDVESFTPREQYDAILQVDWVNPPEYVAY